MLNSTRTLILHNHKNIHDISTISCVDTSFQHVRSIIPLTWIRLLCTPLDKQKLSLLCEHCIAQIICTVLSPIEITSLNVVLCIFNHEMCYNMFKIDIFLISNNIISWMFSRSSSSTILFVVYLWFLLYFIQNMNLNSTLGYA